MISNYTKYRGKCKKLSEQLACKMGYKLVRGYYYEPLWDREEEHWWCVDYEGNIHDPTKLQFPTGGQPEFYREFDGTVKCEQCARTVKEEEAFHVGRYTVCSNKCGRNLVGI